MNRRVWSLIKAQINVGFGISAAGFYYLRKKQRLWEAALILVSLGGLAAAIGFGVYKATAAFYAAYAPLGQGSLALLLGILLSQLVLLVLGFALVVGNFYYANDLSLLIPLPLRPWEVLAGKLGLLLAGEYAALAVFFFPVVLAYGIGAQAAPWPYIPAALVVFLALPVLPLTLAAVPAVLLLRVLGRARRRDALLVAAGFLFTIALLIGQFYMQSRLLGGEGGGAQLLQRILAAAHGLTDLFGRLFPPAAWAARALEAGSPFHLLLFLAASAAGLAAFLFIGNAVFYEGVLCGAEAGPAGRREGAGLEAAGRGIRAASPVAGLALAEARRFTRTPVYVLNGFIGFALFPILILLPGLFSSSPELAGLLAAFRSAPSAGTVGALAMAAYFIMLTAMSTIPFTPFSREGRRHLWILKSLPVDGPAVARAKVRGALLMILPGALPGAAALQWILRLPWTAFAGGLALGALASYILCWAGVTIDLARPMLDWISQEKAIKSNLNALAGMALGLGAVAGGGFGVNALLRLGLPAWMAVGMAAAFLLLLALFARRVLSRVAVGLWERLEQ